MSNRVFERWARLVALLAALALSLGAPALAQMAKGGGPAGSWVAAACSGHGHTDFGRCFCDPGWIGAECDARETPPDCGAHGALSNGRCRCEPGWKGRTCATEAPPKCVHGKADHGKCACDAGWSGDVCDKPQ